ncbi:MAG: ROK family protein [Chloroflexota bacterium]
MVKADVILGIDIGGTHTKLGLVRKDGSLIDFRKMRTDAMGDDPGPFMTRLYLQIGEIGAPFSGIGVSMHGELSADERGTRLGFNTPALIGFDMVDALQSRYGCPVVVSNDLMAHALGEYHFGAGLGVGRFMCMALGTGLGAAMIVDGKPLLIDGGNSGNTGMIILDPTAARDSNGIRGSAEGLCGVAGIEALAAQVYGRSTPAYEVIAGAGKDPHATEVMSQIGAYLGQTLASLSVIFYPHRIVLTGGTTAAGDVLLDACRSTFDDLVGPFFRKITALPNSTYHHAEIVLGKGGSDSGVRGAAVRLMEII